MPMGTEKIHGQSVNRDMKRWGKPSAASIHKVAHFLGASVLKGSHSLKAWDLTLSAQGDHFYFSRKIDIITYHFKLINLIDESRMTVV